ncbi:MAG: hypothetical protein ACJA08_001026 [Cyclobacteriaceae bacterium]|jgi:hypothetical protein
MPEININMMAILIVVVANFIFGFLWYTPIFGKLWAKEMGFDPNQKPQTGAMIKGMVFMVIGNFLFAWVLANNMSVWNPVTWGLPPSDMSPMANASMAAVFTWLGFYLPVDIGAVTWEGKSWKLFAINTGYHFLSLVIAAMILAHML